MERGDYVGNADLRSLRGDCSCRECTAHQPLKALEGRKVYSNAETSRSKAPAGRQA